MAEFADLNRAQARQLAERVLALSKAEGCQVNINATANGNTRYARNEVTTAGDADNATVTVTSRFGKRAASVGTNLLDDAGLASTVETSERLEIDDRNLRVLQFVEKSRRVVYPRLLPGR